MATVGMNLALSLEGLLQRFPSLRDFGIRRLRRTHGEVPPANLAAIIEAEIIPRLLVAHLADSSVRPSAAAGAGSDALAANGAGSHGRQADSRRARIAQADVDAFASATIGREVVDLVGDVEALIGRGVPADAILVDLLAPAAGALGRMWEADRCDFIDVTMGLWRLQELAHEVAARVLPPARSGSMVRRALFAPLPGDDHRFGPLLVAEYFRTCGWDAHCCPGTEADELCAELGGAAYDLLGLTVTQDRQVETLPELIETLREASRNPAVVVMVGGALLVERPELAFLVGADATAPDARAAVERADALVGHRRMGARID